jgi:FkbM family methyltransferase
MPPSSQEMPPMLKQLALLVPQLRRLHDSRREIYKAYEAANDERLRVSALLEHEKRRTQAARSPFWHYAASFDAIDAMHRYAASNLQPTPGYLTNFLGVKIDPKFFPGLLQDRAGQVEGIPIPANWHADVAEWGAALRAIDLSRDTFTMIELGCGWGCWMNNTGVAARKVGRRVHVIGVEGDDGHISFARESLAIKGFSPDQNTLHHGIAAADAGIALFPRQDMAGEKWGLEPVFGATEEQRAAAAAASTHDVLPMVPLSQLAAEHSRIDLLHIDIQGGEADLVDGCLSLLTEKIAYMLIGTHSKQIEGRLYETLLGAGWRLEMERAAILGLIEGQPLISVDGVQGWRNPRLSRD